MARQEARMRLGMALALMLCVASHAFAAGEPASKPMRMDEPMAGKMKKPGMKKGDMKKDAEEKQRTLRPKLQKEEKSMAGKRE
jgi:hypothetical protein